MITVNGLICDIQSVQAKLSHMTVTGPENAELLFKSYIECQNIIDELKASLMEMNNSRMGEFQNEGKLDSQD